MTQIVWGIASEPVRKVGTVIRSNARMMDIDIVSNPTGNIRLPGWATTKVPKNVPVDSVDFFGWKGKRVNFGDSMTTYSRGSSGDLKLTRVTGKDWNLGAGEIFRTIGLGALIEGVFQLYSDLDLCLSNAQRFNRFALALDLGLFGAIAGALAFAGLTAASAPLVVTVLGSLAVGAAVAAATNQIKNNTFDAHPKVFGG